MSFGANRLPTGTGSLSCCRGGLSCPHRARLPFRLRAVCGRGRSCCLFPLPLDGDGSHGGSDSDGGEVRVGARNSDPDPHPDPNPNIDPDPDPTTDPSRVSDDPSSSLNDDSVSRSSRRDTSASRAQPEALDLSRINPLDPVTALQDHPLRVASGAALAVILVALGGMIASVGVQWMLDGWTAADGPFVVVAGVGTLRGARGLTERGTPYASFMGIPYAQPPLEKARFRPPEPLPYSSGLRDGRYEGTVCPQPPSTDYVSYQWRWHSIQQIISWLVLLPRLVVLGVRGILQEEDCLTLNVHTASVGSLVGSLVGGGSAGSSRAANGSSAVGAAVLVWVHGGAFFIGDGNRDEYGPDFFIDEGIVFVSFNYRLGVLGFLSLCTQRAPGNAGLKDQVAALKWVRKHIASFGGDPSRVTVWGESAGAVAVHLLTMSPGKKHLPVQSAIISSGVALANWALEREPRRRAAALASALGWRGPVLPPSLDEGEGTERPPAQPCTVPDPGDNDPLLHFLLKQPAHQLVRHMKDVVADDMTGAENLAWVPCVEPPLTADQLASEAEDPRILIADPAALLEVGSVANIPLIMGVNDHEGMVWLAGKSDAVVRRLLQRIQRQMVSLVVPDLPLLDKPPTSNQSLLAAERIRHFYFGRRGISVNTLPEFIDMYSDILFVVPFMETVAQHLRFSSAPLYLYRFSFDGRLNFCKRIMSVSLPGVSHADELGYLFHIGILPPIEISPTCPEFAMREQIVRLWSNFVRTGNPTPYRDPLLDHVLWEAATPGRLVFLEIGEVLVMRKDMFAERMDFWRDLYHEILLRRVHW